MFIPRGNAVHENLATSYVMVDKLVEDVCEGGFSGVVEVVLRSANGLIIIDRGVVLGAVEQSEDASSKHFGATTLFDLANKARGERGRVSIYSLPPGAAITLAGLAGAERLYSALSTDFADLGKMITKLRRESDRQWFVEVTTQNGGLALVHIENDNCTVLRADVTAESPGGYPNPGQALNELLDECGRVGGSFDVYFRRTGDTSLPEPPAASEEVAAPPQESTTRQSVSAGATPAGSEPEIQTGAEKAASASSNGPGTHHSSSSGQVGAEEPFVIEPHHADSEADHIEHDKDKYWSAPPERLVAVAAAPTPGVGNAPSENKTSEEASARDDEPANSSPTEQEAPMSVAVAEQRGDEGREGEAMAEIKRLMGEIAKTIDDACRAVEQRDAFSMYLRAGQLKIADRYPFLDPFGAEFEYLSGEIVFIGKATPTEFKEGLTESLRLAVVGVAQSSAQPNRLRANVTEKLRNLLDRLRPELEKYELSESVEELIKF